MERDSAEEPVGGVQCHRFARSIQQTDIDFCCCLFKLTQNFIMIYFITKRAHSSKVVSVKHLEKERLTTH